MMRGLASATPLLRLATTTTRPTAQRMARRVEQFIGAAIAIQGYVYSGKFEGKK